MSVADVDARRFGSGGRQSLKILVEHDTSLSLNELKKGKGSR